MSLEATKNVEDICCDNEVSNLDEGYTGKKVPASFSGGPRESKKCTDLLCCFIFVCFVGGIVTAAFLQFPNSKIGIMLTPRDSDGNICGVSQKTKDFPYLYMIKFSSAYRSVCVKECLKFDYNQMRYNSTGTNTTSIPPVTYETFSSAVKQANTSWDKKTQSANVTSVDDPNLFAYDPEAAQGYYTEAQFNNYLKRIGLQCMTNSKVSSCAHNPTDKFFYYDSRPVLLNICFPLAPKLLKYSYFAGDLKTGWVADLKASWWIILVAVVSAVVIGLVFVVLGSFILPILIWVQIIVAILVLLALGVLGIMMAMSHTNPDIKAGLDNASQANAALKERYETLKDRIWLLWVGSIVLILLAILLIYLVAKNYKGIKVAVGVLKFSSGFMLKNILIVGVAIFCFLMQIVTFLLTIWIVLIIHTSGDIEADGSGAPIPRFHYSFGKWCLWIAGIIVVYWTVVFWNNFGDIVCGGATCEYYFKGETRPGIILTAIRCAIWHSGSIALASLILIPVTIIQFIFGWFYDMATDEKPNFIQKCMTKVCCCTIIPYQKWINRVSEVGLIMTYFSSCNFCPSTKRNHYLNKRVGDRIGHVGFIGFLFKISGVLSITGLNYLIFNWVLSNTEYFKTRIQNPLVPIFAIFIFGAIVASLFMSIFSTSTDATLMCYLIELDLEKIPKHSELNEVMQNKNDGYQKL